MDAGTASAAYTVEQIVPLLERDMRRKFLPQSVPFYAAAETLNALRRMYPDLIGFLPSSPFILLHRFSATLLHGGANVILPFTTGLRLFAQSLGIMRSWSRTRCQRIETRQGWMKRAGSSSVRSSCIVS